MAQNASNDAGNSNGRAGQPIRLVALDLDETMLRSDRELAPSVVEAVATCRQRGVRIVLASARPPRSTRAIQEQLGLDSLQINYNGALIIDPNQPKPVYHQPMSVRLTHRLIVTARKLDRNCLISIEILDRWYTDHFDPTYSTVSAQHSEPDAIGPLDSFLTEPVTKMMVLGPPPRISTLRGALIHHFGRRLAFQTSDEHLLQIVHRSVDKAAALKRVAKHYKIKQPQVMAVGDAPNDCRMLQWAGLGAAVRNAWPEAIQAADVVVPSNDEDGVAYALNRFVLDEAT